MRNELLLAVWLAVAATGLLPGLAVGAGSVTATNATTITSKKLMFDYQNGFALFEDDVVVTDPSVVIEADKMTVVFESDNSPKVITASGNVHIKQTDRKATCEKAFYQIKTGRLDLSGNPVVSRGAEMLKGKIITFWRDQDKMDVQEAQVRFYNTATNSSLKQMLGE